MENSLIFPWKIRYHSRTLFLACFSSTVVAHLIILYVVRIIEPLAESWVPHTHQITILSAQDDRALPLLRDLADQSYFLTFSEASRSEEPTPDRVRFVPSFANHEIKLSPFAATVADPVRRELWTSDLLAVLPPLPSTEMTQPDVPVASRRIAYMNFGPRLGRREVEVDHDRLAEWFRAGHPCYYRLYAGVPPHGRVQVLSVTDELEGQLSAAELEMIRQSLQFSPASDWTWDWIEIHR